MNNILKVLLGLIVFLITSFNVRSENSNGFDIARIGVLDDGLKNEVESFFQSIKEKDYERTYELSSERFKVNFSKDWFLKRIGRWSVDELDVLAISETSDLGFYMIISYRESNSDIVNRSVTVFFWKVENGSARFFTFAVP
ncbi:hypothetical protein MLD52_18550 [Puniceicoccaceae bacterium K14]|nr:hypothetical protein [Puniceicoccaceae bacterium K14]